MTPDYLPKPKVVAAVLGGLLVIGLLVVARLAGVEVDAGWLWGLLTVAGSAVAGYGKTE